MSLPILLLRKRKLRHSLGKPSRSDFVQMEVVPPKVIEVGKIATVRTSPSVKKNIMLGFLLGFVACAGIIVVYAVMDDTIKTEEDIEKYLGVSVLAKVPDRKDYINTKKNKGRGHR